MFCSTCGQPLPVGSLLCPSCGASVPKDVRTEARPGNLGVPTLAGSAPLMAHSIEAPTSTMAIVSLVTGIASYALVPILGALVAIITGHLARREIRETNGRIKGKGLATAGLVLGYAHFALVCFAFAVVMFLIGIGVIAGNH